MKKISSLTAKASFRAQRLWCTIAGFRWNPSPYSPSRHYPQISRNFPCQTWQPSCTKALSAGSKGTLTDFLLSVSTGWQRFPGTQRTKDWSCKRKPVLWIMSHLYVHYGLFKNTSCCSNCFLPCTCYSLHSVLTVIWTNNAHQVKKNVPLIEAKCAAMGSRSFSWHGSK